MVYLKKVCEYPINLRIISFFHENPATIDTSRNIATWLNRNQNEIRRALDYLVNKDILIVHRTGSTVAYAYTQDKEIVEKIEKFLQDK